MIFLCWDRKKKKNKANGTQMVKWLTEESSNSSILNVTSVVYNTKVETIIHSTKRAAVFFCVPFIHHKNSGREADGCSPWQPSSTEGFRTKCVLQLSFYDVLNVCVYLPGCPVGCHTGGRGRPCADQRVSPSLQIPSHHPCRTILSTLLLQEPQMEMHRRHFTVVQPSDSWVVDNALIYGQSI